MSNKSQKSFNGQVFEKTYQRLNLTSTERTIFQRLLGFLIRNDKPFPYSAIAMAELTGFDKRTVFRSLNRLEQLRLIERIGMGKNRKFIRGSILRKILTTVTNREKIKQSKNLTTATLCHQKLINRDIVSYKKTSSFIKHKEKNIFFNSEYQEYKGRLQTDINLGLIDKNTKIMKFDEWNRCIAD